MFCKKSQSLSLAFLFEWCLAFAQYNKTEKAVKKESECRTSAKTCYTIARYNSLCIKNITIIGFVAKECRNCRLFAYLKLVFDDVKFSNSVSGGVLS